MEVGKWDGIKNSRRKLQIAFELEEIRKIHKPSKPQTLRACWRAYLKECYCYDGKQ